MSLQQIKKNSTSSKENNPPSKKVRSVSASDQSEHIIDGIKANATKTLSNVKSTFDNITQKLRRSSRKSAGTWRCQPYKEFANVPATPPVKLYSPFGILTPSPSPQRGMPVRRKLTPKRFAFSSPTGKLKQDIEELSSGLRELNAVARTLRKKSDSK